ncbi:speckle-type POZ protein A-like [Trichogramma pretiosum]|uniref:speckle-type POZ protein A-like n=1 Tax=Trichogramma pretiosum TaxID=7493 RepID=UPI0006C95F18|nr:speckle-type POZ protein A-like [Trichogramma pretiosum]
MSGENKVTGCTYVDKAHCDFTWIIRDYGLVYNNQPDPVASPIFRVGQDDRRQFRLELHDITSEMNNKHYTVLFLVCKKAVDVLSLKYKVTVIKDDTIVYNRQCSDRFASNRWQLFISPREYMHKFISSTDTATFRCELTLSTDVRKDFSSDESVDTNQVQKLEFDWAFLDKKLSDVKLRTASGKEIPAHRLILSAASPVFKAMFSHDTLENKNQSVDIIDISYEITLEMLRYVYTGIIENDKISFIIELLMAADKYAIDDLKNKCEMTLSSNLSSENVVDILKVADKCSMKKLKKTAVNFVKMHINQFSDTDDVAGMILSMEQLFSN